MSLTNPTLGELKSAVVNRGYDGTPTGMLTEVIDSAQREILAAKRWPFLVSTSTLTLAANASSISLGGIADLAQVDAVRDANSDVSDDLEWRPLTRLRRELNRWQDIRDAPAAWTREAANLLIFPRADKTYTLEVDYSKEVAALSDDGDLLVIPRRYMDAVVWGACSNLAARQRDVYSALFVYQGNRDAAVARMSIDLGMEQRQGGRVVVETGFWDDMT